MVDPWVQFAERLQELRRKSGNPSVRELVKATDPSRKRNASDPYTLAEKVKVVIPKKLSSSTVSRLLRAGQQQGAPDWDMVATFVVACVSHAARVGQELSGRPASDELPNLIRTWRLRHQDLVEDLAAATTRPDALPERLGAPRGSLDRHRAGVWNDLVPLGGVPDRGAELDELSAFCRGDDPYAWWVGVPWAGKTALMATFAVEPPPDVEVVSFFVNARLLSQANSAAMVPALVGQLYDIVVAGRPEQRMRFVDADWSVLLREAAALFGGSGRRLLLLVDGLDEDRGAAVGSGLRSIAEMLPSSVPDGLRVLVTSRPDYRVPDAVPGSHPLKSCRPRSLAKSPSAADIERLARLELNQLLNGSHAERTVLGLIAASGGGLAPTDLVALAGLPWPTLREMFDGVFGRTVVRRDIEGVEGVLFAHEALRAQAAGEVGPDLPGYRQLIIDRARGFAKRHWPAETPAYLLRDYPRMVRAASQRDELVHLATDADRHKRLYEATGGDGAALQEIKDAQDVICGAPELTLADLTVLADLAAHRDDLLRRNQNIPPALPGLWVRLGKPARGRMLAKSIADPQRRAGAQRALDRAGPLVGPAPAPSSSHHHRVQALAKAIELAPGETARGELIAEVERESALIPDLYQRAGALTIVIKSMAAAGFGDRMTMLIGLAQATAAAVEPIEKRDQALRVLTRAVALTGDDARAEALARTITDVDVREQALAALAMVLADQRKYPRAEALVMAITTSERRGRVVAHFATKTDQRGYSRTFRLVRRMDHHFWRASALLTLAAAALDRGEQNRAKECIRHARTAVRMIADDTSRNKVLTRLVTTLGRMGEFPDARSVARRITDDNQRAGALTELAKIAASAGHTAVAVTLPRAINNPYHQANAVRVVVEVLAHQDVEAARELTNSVREPDWHARCLIALAQALASTGGNVAAEAVISDITTPERRAAAYAALIRVADPADQQRVVALVELATASVASIDGRLRQAEALTAVAESTAAVGAVPTARHLAERAERIARDNDDMSHRVRDLCLLARARAATGDAAATDLAGQAQRCAELIGDPDERLVALADVAHTRNAIGDEDGALELVRTIVASYRSGRSVATLIATLAEAGCGDLAKKFALSITDPRWRAQSLADVAVSAAREGRRKRAKTLTEKAGGLLNDVADPVARVRVLVRLDQAMTLSDRPKLAAALVRQAEKLVAGIHDAGRRTQASNLLTPPSPAPVNAPAGTEPPEANDVGQAHTDAEERVRSLINQIRAAGLDSTTVEALTEQAATLARGMDAPYQRAKTLGTLAHAAATSPAHVRVDDLIAEATRRADAIADPRRHADALQTLVLAAAAAGHRQWCHQLGERASALIPPTMNNSWPVSVQRTVVQIALTADDLDLAYAITSAINNPSLKLKTLRELAEAEARRARVDRARTIAGTITEPDHRQTALEAVARAASPGHPTTLDAAEPVAAPVSGAKTLIGFLGSSPHIPDGVVHDTGAGAEAISDQSQRTQLTPVTIRTLIGYGHIDQAEELARTLPDIDLRVQTFTSLVTANAAADRQGHALCLVEQAAQWADTVEPPYRNARLLAALTEAVAAIGEADHARTLTDRAMCRADAIDTANRRAEVLTALLRAMALIGDHQRCLELARTIGPRRNRALSETITMIAKHNLDTARTLAGYITDPFTRGSALVAAAQSRSEPDVIRTLVASALRHGSWTQVLADPTALPPEIVNAVANFVTLRQTSDN